MQTLRRKPSKRRVVSNGAPNSNNPSLVVAPKPSSTIVVEKNVQPDTAISEVTSSMAAMLSQSSTPSSIELAEELRRQHRAATADMTTALSQQRRLEIAEEQARAQQAQQAQRVVPGPSMGTQNHGPFHDDMDTDDESTDSETLGHASSGQTAFPVIQSDIVPSAENRHDVGSPEVDMDDADASQGFFVPANPNRPSQIPEVIPANARGPSPGPETTHVIGETQTPVQVPETPTQWLEAEVARLDARRDEQVCIISIDPLL